MRYVTLIFLVLCTTNIKAANYYLSGLSGDDSRNSSAAQNPLTPWKTLTRLNSFIPNLQPGDSVLFKRGETFYGGVVASNSGTSSQPIVFAAYGAGAKPIISGLTTLTGWINKGNGIWESNACDDAGPKANIVLINGVSLPMGRFPNADAPNGGFLTYTSHTGNTSITDSKLPASPNWTGAELIVKKERWIFDRSLILNHSGNTLTYKAQTDYYPANGYGYFIQNSLQTLDEAGEWYFNPATKKFYVFNGNVQPTNVQLSTVNNLALIQYSDFLTFKNICFKGSNLNGFDLEGLKNVTVDSCDIEFAGIDAIYGVSLTNFQLINSTITSANNNSVYLAYNCKFTTIKNNVIKKGGLNIGMGDAINYNTLAGISTGGAGANSSPNTLIEGNVLDSIGYNAISFVGDNTIIKNNFLTNFCMVKDDGGGIYTSKGASDKYTYSGSQIIGNIVLNGKVSAMGTPDISRVATWGIYIDDNSQGIALLNNTVAGMPNAGIFVHNAHDIVVKENTLYNNGIMQLQMEHDDNAPNTPVRGNTVTGNILFAKQQPQLSAKYQTKDKDIATFGSFDNNYYTRPVDDNLVINTQQQINAAGSTNVNLNLDNWRVQYIKDPNSVKPAFKIPAFTVDKVIGGELFVNSAFSSDITGLALDNPTGNCSLAWKSGQLDGGALMVSFNAITGPLNYGSVVLGIGPVTAGNVYHIKFSVFGQKNNKAVIVYLKQNGGAKIDLSARQAAQLSGSRVEEDLFFTAGVTQSNANLAFDIPEQTTPVFFDNIQANLVEATKTNPDNYIQFFYNPGFQSKTFSLIKAGTDVFGNSYAKSVTVNPFQSAIIVNDADCVIPPKPVIIGNP